MQIWKSAYIRLHMKIIYWRFYVKIPFTFWEWARETYENFVYKHSETIDIL